MPQLAEAGVRRISVGSAFSNAALGAVASAARELREQGTYGFLDQAASGRAAAPPPSAPDPARPAAGGQPSRLRTMVGRSMTWSSRSGRTAVPMAKNSVVCEPQV